MKKISRKRAVIDYLTPLLTYAPAGWALVRANEIRALERIKVFQAPVLDVGCGDGLVASVMLQKKNKFEVGIDIFDREVKKAQKLGIYKHCLVASIYSLPFPNSSFATVFSNSVIEHIRDLDRALDEINRVLTPDGRMVITVPSVYLARYLLGTAVLSFLKLDFLAKIYGNFFNKLFKHYNVYDHDQWAKILQVHDLRLVDHFYYHTPSIVKVHEILSLLAFPIHILKPLVGYWVVFPKIRRWLIVPWVRQLLWRFYIDDCQKDQGGSLLLVAQKTK